MFYIGYLFLSSKEIMKAGGGAQAEESTYLASVKS
jgi:hypothetical protein